MFELQPIRTRSTNQVSRISLVTLDSTMMFTKLRFVTGGSVIEEADDGRRVLKPYNVNEMNKPRPEDEEAMPKHSLVTASIMA